MRRVFLVAAALAGAAAGVAAWRRYHDTDPVAERADAWADTVTTLAGRTASGVSGAAATAAGLADKAARTASDAAYSSPIVPPVVADAVSAAAASAGAAVSDAAEVTTAALAAASATDREAPLRAADDYLMGLAHAFVAWAFAASARGAVSHPDSAWAEAKTARMRYGVQWVLPQAQVHWARAGDAGLELPQVGAA